MAPGTAQTSNLMQQLSAAARSLPDSQPSVCQSTVMRQTSTIQQVIQPRTHITRAMCSHDECVTTLNPHDPQQTQQPGLGVNRFPSPLKQQWRQRSHIPQEAVQRQARERMNAVASAQRRSQIEPVVAGSAAVCIHTYNFASTPTPGGAVTQGNSSVLRRTVQPSLRRPNPGSR